jgi:hypothetical protein
MQQEDDGNGSTWFVIQPDRAKSQAPVRRDRRGMNVDSDDEQSLSINIGPDNTVSVDSGRRRRM